MVDGPVAEELYELGLVKLCSQPEYIDGHRFRCGRPTAEYGGLCGAHGGTALIKQRAVLDREKTSARIRKRLEDEILPVATARVMEALADGETKISDIVRIWATTMDRVGIPAVSGVALDAKLEVSAPLDILRQMLGQVEDSDVVDGEVVGE